MKKILNIIFVSLLIFTLTSCFGKTKDEDIEDVKNELLNQNTNTGNTNFNNNGSGNDVPAYVDEGETQNGNDNTQNPINTDDNSNNNITSNTKANGYEVTYLTSEKFLELNNLNTSKLSNLELEITGTTLTNVDKVVVSFSNTSSNYPNDTYTLSQFKAGDKTFLYRAFSKYQTLDYGENMYIIEAYSGNEVSKLQLIVNVNKNGTTQASNNSSNNTTNSNSVVFDASGLPTSTTYGNPQSTGGGKYTYTSVNGLEIEQLASNIPVETSDDVMNFLTDNISTWFYWNSSRPISNGEGMSVYVIRLVGENYIYEKHYYTPNGYHGVVRLETGTGVDKENISDKNIELRDKNDTFTITEITDQLFRDMIK